MLRIFIALSLMAAAYYTSDYLWGAVPHGKLLDALWKVAAIILGVTAIGYTLKNQLTEVTENEYLTTSESEHLNRTIKTRRLRINFYLFFGVFTALYLVASLIAGEFPNLSPWYFKSVSVATTLQLTLFAYVLLTLSEVESFKSKLDLRKRKAADKEKLLKQLSEDE